MGELSAVFAGIQSGHRKHLSSIDMWNKLRWSISLKITLNISVSTEGFQSWMWRGLTFLLPFLFFGHVSTFFFFFFLKSCYCTSLCIQDRFTPACTVSCLFSKARLLHNVFKGGLEMCIKGDGAIVRRCCERQRVDFFSFGSCTTRLPSSVWPDTRTVKNGR